MFGMGMGFDLYVMDKEGVFDSERKKAVKGAIAEFRRKKSAGMLSNADIDPVLRKFGLSLEELSDAEADLIQEEVMGRF
jgi:hypothetical protein